MKLNEAAAKIHEYICLNPETWASIEEKYRRECDASSSAIDAWQQALKHTKYSHSLDGATYTGNMKSIFVKSKLFDAIEPDISKAVPGDLFLNETSNVVIYQGDGKVSGFIIDEFTSDLSYIYKGVVIDFYEDSWDVLLHYNGKADS